jgi:hypothetical protein
MGADGRHALCDRRRDCWACCCCCAVPIRASRRDLAVLAGAGVLLLGSGNGFVFLGETTVPSRAGGAGHRHHPLWVAALEMLIPGGERLTAGGWAGLALGWWGWPCCWGRSCRANRPCPSTRWAWGCC